MKLISVLLIFLFSAPAVARLYTKQDENTMVYYLYGDMDRMLITEQSKVGIPMDLRPVWPTRNGVWIFALHTGPMKQPPLYVAPNLLPSDDPGPILSQLVASRLSIGFALNYIMDKSTLNSLAFMICDYKTNLPIMICKIAQAGAGQIEPPPPVEPKLSCSIVGAIDLHHGSLTLDTIANDSVSTVAYVTCSRKATVNLSIEGMVKLNGVDGLFSQLTVGDAPVDKLYSFTADSTYTPVIFKSVLKTVGTVTPGDFNGSARVELTFP